MKQIERDLSGIGIRIAIVQSRFNEEVGKNLLQSCQQTLLQCGVIASNITLATVPGALEIPLTLQQLAQTGMYDGLIALGAVIRGETYHFEVVSNESARGVSDVQLNTGVPVANGILTSNTDQQALARAAQKGKEVAEAVIEMANLLKKIRASE